eukprot:11518829-Ditylum_brightwellii.AAC.1
MASSIEKLKGIYSILNERLSCTDKRHVEFMNKFTLLTVKRIKMELDRVASVYERYKELPQRPRNTPSVSGAIMWSRNLLRRVDEYVN